ncbi:MAG: thioredoxin domain-containing protein [Candidatus Pacebacteria bacterium]|nr:thioredoxin domain-containing protein [Candidatus Paceibacterota bacterium]
MGNTSKKRRNRRLWTGGIIAVVALLIISFFVSQSGDPIDEAAFANLEVSALEPRIKGNAESGNILIEYSDFQCPACKAAAPAVDALVEQYGDQFALEYRHYPLRSIHPNAQLAAQAAEAAGMQGMFWEMHDLLFENQSEWSQSFNPERFFRTYALELGLNEDRFRFDMESDQVKDLVNSHFDEAQELGIPGTPGFVFNGEIVDVNTFVNENLDLSVGVEAELVTEGEE